MLDRKELRVYYDAIKDGDIKEVERIATQFLRHFATKYDIDLYRHYSKVMDKEGIVDEAERRSRFLTAMDIDLTATVKLNVGRRKLYIADIAYALFRSNMNLTSAAIILNISRNELNRFLTRHKKGQDLMIRFDEMNLDIIEQLYLDSVFLISSPKDKAVQLRRYLNAKAQVRGYGTKYGRDHISRIVKMLNTSLGVKVEGKSQFEDYPEIVEEEKKDNTEEEKKTVDEEEINIVLYDGDEDDKGA